MTVSDRAIVDVGVVGEHVDQDGLVLAGCGRIGIGDRGVVDAGDVEDERAGVAAVIVRDGVVEAVLDVLARRQRLRRGVQRVAVGAVRVERQGAVGADEGAAGHGQRVAVEIEIVGQHARRAAVIGADVLVREDMVVDRDRPIVAAADVDDPVGEDEPLDADQLVVAVRPGAAQVQDVQIAGAGDERIFLDQPGIISGVEAVPAVEEIVVGAAGEMVGAVVAKELVVPVLAVQRIDAVAAGECRCRRRRRWRRRRYCR